MNKLSFILLVTVSTLFAAPPPPDASDVTAVLVPDSKGVLHNAGQIQDVVKNYPSLSAAIRADAKAKIEAKIDAADAKTSNKSAHLAPLKPEIDLAEAAGVVFNASKKSLVVNSVTIENEKKAERESKKEK